MDSSLLLLVLVGGTIVLVFLRVPVAFALLVLSTIALMLGGDIGPSLQAIVRGFGTGLASFALTTVPMFVLMGELMFRSGSATTAVDAMNRILGRIPGRLPMLANVSGSILGAVSGSAMASTAILARSLLPRMEEEDYPRPLSMGSIMAAGGVAMVIPPSTMAVILGATGSIPVGPLLLAGLIPGLLMGLNYTAVIQVWSWFIRRRRGPEAMSWTPTPWLDKLRLFARYVMPLALIIFAVTGLIVLGVATPNESAAVGALASLVAARFYGKLSWAVIKDAVVATAKVTGALLIIVGASTAFSQTMAATGVSRGIVETLIGAAGSAVGAVLVMLVIVTLMGCLLDQVAITLVTLPFFVPVIAHFDINPVWFGILMLQALELGTTTPPFGVSLFVMKEYAPAETTTAQVYQAVAPFLACDYFAIFMVMLFPALALWLPGVVLG